MMRLFASAGAFGVYVFCLSASTALAQPTLSETTLDLDPELQGLQEIVEEQAFTDVQESDWFAPYVEAVAKWGIVSGYSDAQGRRTGQFGPGGLVTVAEVLKMAMRAAKVDERTCTGEPQMSQARTHWAKTFVVCGEQHNMRLLTAWPDLNRPALRGEVLSIVHDAFGEKVPPLLSKFTDTAGHLYETDIAFAEARGIISGDTDALGRLTGSFRPNDGVVRAEMAKIIYEKLKADVTEE